MPAYICLNLTKTYQISKIMDEQWVSVVSTGTMYFGEDWLQCNVRKPTRDITINIFSARFFLFPQGYFLFPQGLFYFRKVCFISTRFVLFPQGYIISARFILFPQGYLITPRFVLFPQGYFNFRENIFNGNHQATGRPRSFGVMARFEQ